MRHAFHFLDDGDGWHEYDRALLGALRNLGPQRNFVVSRGNILDRDFGASENQILQNARQIHLSASGTIQEEDYLNMLLTERPYVQLVQGMTRAQMTEAHALLGDYPSYVGVLELHFDDRLQWAIYGTKLPDQYRVVGSELRIRWRAIDGDDAEDFAEERRDTWARTGLFESVALEDVGLRSTIFDGFDTAEHAALEAAAHHMLGDLLQGVAGHVLLRASDLDPRLVESLHAALKSLDTASTSEELAQAALSCRRFLERFADRVFPATDEKRNGRELGPAQWKNRLWAFVEDALGESNAGGIGADLQDIGARIDSLVDAANAGVHRSEVEGVATTRLVIGLVSLVFDLCLISPPPHKPPEAGYERHARALIREMLGRDASSPKE